MKTILYGDNGETMQRVKRIFEPLVETIHVIYSPDGKTGLISDYEDADVDAIVFVGICPAEELTIALTIGLKVFVMLVPIETKTNSNIVVCQTGTLKEEDKILEEFEEFFEKKAS